MNDILIGAAVGCVVLAVVFGIVPLIGGNIETGIIQPGPTSQWNSSVNADLQGLGGADIWEQLSPFLIVCGLVVLAGIIIMALRWSAMI